MSNFDFKGLLLGGHVNVLIQVMCSTTGFMIGRLACDVVMRMIICNYFYYKQAQGVDSSLEISIMCVGHYEI